jgi:hypothetical protein
MGDRFMSIRMLVWVLLVGATCANAAPPDKSAAAAASTSASPAAENIDVDALARAKDVDAKKTDTNAQDTRSANGDQQAPAPVAADAPAPSAPGEASTGQAAPANAADPSSVPLSPQAPQPPQSGAPDAHLAAACESRATSLLDAAQKGDYAAAVSDFDAKMRTALPAAKFQRAWETLAQFGALQARGQSHPAMDQGYVAITIPLIFEKANLYAQIACGSDGRIAGFYVKPLEMPDS